MDIRRIRDFIYIDIDRVKSIISQLEEGLIDQTQILSGNSEGSALRGEGGLSGFFKAAANSEFKFHRQLSETKSLHDYIYNKVESLLLNEKQLLEIPNEKSVIYSSDMRETIGNSSFILTKGKVTINDFRQLKMFLENFDDFAKFIARCCVSTQIKNSTKSEQKIACDKMTSEFQKSLDKDFRNGLIQLIDMFYQNRIIIKVIPYKEYPDFRFVGNLDKTYLRDDIESIIYKYGTAPVSDWTVFGQVASVTL